MTLSDGPVLSGYHKEKTGELPAKLDDLAVRSVLMAHFWVARLCVLWDAPQYPTSLIF